MRLLTDKLYVLLILALTSCGVETEEEEESVVGSQQGSRVTGIAGSGGATNASPLDSLSLYVFGNSLLVHEYTDAPTEEKKVPHWLGQLATNAGVQVELDGMYGFMRNYEDFSNISPQWSFGAVASKWSNPSEDFSSVAYDAVIYTPNNFIQYQGPTITYYDSETVSPVSTTLSTIDQTIAAQGDDTIIYIYEGWADMDGYGSFPSGVDLEKYYLDSLASYHDWYIEYHDQLVLSRPNVKIRMIPVNLILTKLFTSTMLSSMTILDKYEDDAPHGQGSLYFLASLITYTSIFRQLPPEGYVIPETVHAAIRDNYAAILGVIWEEVTAFNFQDGTSRVFP